MLTRYETSFMLPLLSAVLLILTLPYIGWWPLVWVALTPFFFFATNTTISRMRLFLGTFMMIFLYELATLLPLASISGWWWSSSGSVERILSNGFFYVLALALLGLWATLCFFPVALVVRRYNDHPFAPLLIGVVWVIIELFNGGFGFLGFSWGALGYTLIDTTIVKHLAELPIFGVFALSMLIVATNYGIVTFLKFFHVRQGRFFERIKNTFGIFIDEWRLHIGLLLLIFVFMLTILFGVWREAFPTPFTTPVTVALISSHLSNEQVVAEDAYHVYREKLVDALERGAQFVVFPENTFPYFVLDEHTNLLVVNPVVPTPTREAFYADLRAISRQYKEATIIFGVHTMIRRGVYHNSAVYLRAGEIQSAYRKRILVPFTEQAPRWMPIHLVKFFVHGERTQYFDVGGITTTVLTCSEVGATTLPIHNAQLIFAPSTDGIFTNDRTAIMEINLARMRALEAGAFLLRPSKGGISAVIDPSGRVVETSYDDVIVRRITLPSR